MKPSSATTLRSALHRALRQPPLFAALLGRYVVQGRVPNRLAGVLWRDYGITRKASRVAAETFCQSARYAEVLDREGAFLSGAEGFEQALDQKPAAELADAQSSSGGIAAEQRFEFALTRGRVARLFLPLELCRKDLEIVHRQIDFLEYQVMKEEHA